MTKFAIKNSDLPLSKNNLFKLLKNIISRKKILAVSLFFFHYFLSNFLFNHSFFIYFIAFHFHFLLLYSFFSISFSSFMFFQLLFFCYSIFFINFPVPFFSSISSPPFLLLISIVFPPFLSFLFAFLF